MKPNFRTMLTAAALGLLAAPAALPAKHYAGTVLSPLERQVRHELVTLPFFGVFDNLAFRVDGREVTLMGQVSRPTLKTDAERVVARLEGVEKVVNRIEVLPLSNFDNRIRLQTYRAIYGHSAMLQHALQPIAPIRIIVKNGNVTLEGAAGSEMAKNIAYLQANGVPGVFSVTNNLVVNP